MKNNLELRDGNETSSGVGAKLGRIAGNPDFLDQFNLTFKTYYYDVTHGVMVAAAALPASLKNKLPVFLFGNSDYAGGFQKTRSFFPLTTWSLLHPAAVFYNYGIINKEIQVSNQIVSNNLTPFVKTGQLFFQYFATVAGTSYVALIVIDCPQVAYGSLLDSINSDIFQINMIRYYVDPTNLNQLTNQILILHKSTFGKTQDDWIDPNLFVTGKTFNTNIADIPLNMEINKSKSFGFYIEYDCINFNWSITVESTKKITL